MLLLESNLQRLWLLRIDTLLVVMAAGTNEPPCSAAAPSRKSSSEERRKAQSDGPVWREWRHSSTLPPARWEREAPPPGMPPSTCGGRMPLWANDACWAFSPKAAAMTCYCTQRMRVGAYCIPRVTNPESVAIRLLAGDIWVPWGPILTTEGTFWFPRNGVEMTIFKNVSTCLDWENWCCLLIFCILIITCSQKCANNVDAINLYTYIK